MKITKANKIKVTPLKALSIFLVIFFPPGINSIIRSVLNILSDRSAIKPVSTSTSLSNRIRILGKDNSTEIKSNLFQLFLK